MPKGKVNIETPARYNDFYDEWSEDTYSYSWKAPSPGSLRGKIRKFLEEYDVTASSLQRVLGVNAGSFTQFMTGKYKDPWAATQNGTYRAAAYFFHVDKLLGKDGIIYRLKATRVRLLPIRPRSRCARRSLRTFPVVTLHPRFPFNV